MGYCSQKYSKYSVDDKNGVAAGTSAHKLFSRECILFGTRGFSPGSLGFQWLRLRKNFGWKTSSCASRLIITRVCMREPWLSSRSRRAKSRSSKPRSPNCKSVCLAAKGNGDFPRRRGWPNDGFTVAVASNAELGGMVVGAAPPCRGRRWWSKPRWRNGFVRVAVCPLKPRARRRRTRKSNGRSAWCAKAIVANAITGPATAQGCRIGSWPRLPRA